ncbi:hypothetical protein JX265_009494 [Neoarthrinium moseri]|uniref:Uncharacterized protein n=1 Tax=Neoarthrinium moseri TaxID=1658444 RepID=A0A9P9WG44_9PEZI|nr:hypothetical protein JX265_009494 [Neoarthrinium moseri]
MENDWMKTMNMAKFPDLDLGPLPEDPVIDFDILNTFPFDPNTFDPELDKRDFSAENDVTRHLVDISNRLQRIEEGMATSKEMSSLASNMTLGLQQLERLVERLRQGLEMWAKCLINGIPAEKETGGVTA